MNDDRATDAGAEAALEPPRSERSTLENADAQVELAQAEAVSFVTRVREVLDASVAAAVLVEPDLSTDFVIAAELGEEITRAFTSRYGEPPASRVEHPFAGPLRDWNSAAETLVVDLETEKAPWRSQPRAAQQWGFASRASVLLVGLPNAEQEALRSAFLPFRSRALEVATSYFEGEIGGLKHHLDEMTAPPAVVGYMGPGAMDGGTLPGTGRLRLVSGFATLSQLLVTFREPGQQTGSETETTGHVATRPFAIPLFLDLDRDGGLVTNAKSTVDAVVLRLLALLPAGELRMTLFDPARLGESASFLFGLKDSAAAIMGEKVKSTDREIQETLVELEEHITFVTQKYLQGTYDSLTDYNVAAGDVAEPYRLLVLYDYPAGFVRSNGQPDEDALARLTKIVHAGPHCGVFTFALTGGTTLTGPTLAPLSTLPRLTTNRPLEPALLNRLVSGDGETSLAPLLFSVAGVGTSQRDVARKGEGSVFVSGGSAAWLYAPDEAVPGDVCDAILAQVERGLMHAADVRVTAEHVSHLAKLRLNRSVEIGTKGDEVLPEPRDPNTWWRGSSIDSVSADFGRVGAADVGTLTFDSQTYSGALVGGRPGAGKSVLLHAITASLCLRYSPDELELYLVDFKEGVEFKVYAAGRLPHARVVAVESEREFGVAVLESLDAEMSRRGALFRGGSGEEFNLGTYRSRTGASLSRIVLIIDEFHVLFDRDDKIASRAAELLDRIVRQGRAFGVHTILASQTLAGTAALGRHTLNQIPIRIALQCSEIDSRLLLGDDNPDAQLLTRPGEGVFNAANGLRDANRRFQTTFWSGEDRAALVAALAERADRNGRSRKPVVFEGHQPVRTSEIADENFIEHEGSTALQIPLGLPMALTGPTVATLRREPGGNLLIVADEEQAYSALTVALVAATRASSVVYILDFGAADAAWTPALDLLAGPKVRPARSRQTGEILREIADLVAERLKLQDYKSAPVTLIISALHRAREFDTVDDVGEIGELLESILRDGPDVGVHCVVWCDRLVSLDRRLSSTTQREFGMRLIGPMSKEDSFRLIDTESAGLLDDSQMILDDHDRARSYRLRRFAQPEADWISRIVSAT